VKAGAVQGAQQVEDMHERSVTRREGAEKQSALGAFDLYCRAKYEGGVRLLDGLHRVQGDLDEGARYSREEADASGVYIPAKLLQFFHAEGHGGRNQWPRVTAVLPYAQTNTAITWGFSLDLRGAGRSA
jgi:hypothetical protein